MPCLSSLSHLPPPTLTLLLLSPFSTYTIFSFHSSCPSSLLAPFPLLSQANLPLLQRELLHCARMAKQTPAQYLAQHEQLLLDANASSPLDSSEIMMEINEHGKRRTPDRY